MPRARAGGLQSEINVTPLVDVVLVLLIIFMVIAPQLSSGPAVALPATARPQQKDEGGKALRVAIEKTGAIWIGGERVGAERLAERLAEAARERRERPVVLAGDAGLAFGAVRQTMLAIEAAGFDGVALIAERER